MDTKLYGNLQGEKAEAEEFITDVKATNSDKLKKNDRYIEAYLTCLYCKNKLESMDGWNDGESFKKMMSAYPEYTYCEDSQDRGIRVIQAKERYQFQGV